MKKAVEAGVNVNIRHSLGWTALQTAAMNGRSDVVRYLVKVGADVNLGDDFVNIYRTAMEKGMSSLEGIFLTF